MSLNTKRLLKTETYVSMTRLIRILNYKLVTDALEWEYFYQFQGLLINKQKK